MQDAACTGQDTWRAHGLGLGLGLGSMPSEVLACASRIPYIRGKKCDALICSLILGGTRRPWNAILICV